MKPIIIDLLRHGDAAQGKKLLGMTDEPLTELGWQQMRAVIPHKQPPWHHIISSPLQRCQDFSQALSVDLKLPLTINKAFQEIHFGDWDGKLLAELYQSDAAEDLLQFMQNPMTIIPPHGEAYILFEQRVLDAWKELLLTLQQNNIEHCLLVTHAGVIRTLISHILGTPETHLFRLEVPYACLSRIHYYQGSPESLSFHNGSLIEYNL